MKPIVLIGGGGHCKSVIDVIEEEEKYRIAGIVDIKDKYKDKILGYEIFANDDDLKKLVKEYPLFLITIGQVGANHRRSRLFEKMKKMGASFPVIISPTAYVSGHSQIGEGTVVLHGAVINAETRIGVNGIINTKAVVEHEVTIGNHTHISTGAIINGNCCVGDHCFIGSHSNIMQERTIADYVITGANSTAIEDLGEAGTYVGTPTRKLKGKEEI